MTATVKLGLATILTTLLTSTSYAGAPASPVVRRAASPIKRDLVRRGLIRLGMGATNVGLVATVASGVAHAQATGDVSAVPLLFGPAIAVTGMNVITALVDAYRGRPSSAVAHGVGVLIPPAGALYDVGRGTTHLIKGIRCMDPV